MTTYAPAAVVAPPDISPAPFGLFSQMTLSDFAGDRWENGVTWEGPTCDAVLAYTATCETPPNFSVYSDGGVNDSAVAYYVRGSYKCSPVGRSISEAQDRATANLLAGEQAAVEARFWTELADATPLLGNVAGESVSTALGLLEAYIVTQTGGSGVIHVPRSLIPTLAEHNLISTSGQRMTTILGTGVSAGNYVGNPSDLADPPAGFGYMAVTPPLVGQRGEIFTGSDRPGDLLDRAQNNLYALAQRGYLIGHSTCGTALVTAKIGCCP